MRIAFVVGFAWEPKGTARARAFPLAAELVRKGHEVALFMVPYDNPSESGRRHEVEGVRIVNVAVGAQPGWRHAAIILARLAAALREYAPDLVHVFKPKGYAGAAGVWLLLKASPGVVLDCDDWEGWGGWNEVKHYPWMVKEYIDRQEKWLIRHAPVVTVASRILQERAFNLHRSRDDVYYLPNCGASRANVIHQEAALALAPDEAKAAFGLGSGTAIFYSGHIDAGQDTLFFCRTVGQVAKKHSATITVAGDGPGIAQVTDFMAGLGVATRSFPRLPYADYVRLIAAADVAVFPYPDNPVHQAKCSARIIDYMVMGRAVLTNAVGQNNEYIVDGVSGTLSAPGDEDAFRQSLEQLLQSPALRARLGQEARRRVKEKFSWGGEPLENCLAAYRQVWRGRFQPHEAVVTEGLPL